MGGPHMKFLLKGTRIPQLVGCLTEKLGVILTWVQAPGAARDFFSQSQHPVQTTL